MREMQNIGNMYKNIRTELVLSGGEIIYLLQSFVQPVLKALSIIKYQKNLLHPK